MTDNYSNYMFVAQSQFKEKKQYNLSNQGYSIEYKLSGNTLTALISTDGTNWSQLPANIAVSTDWAISGDVSLAQYSGNIRIAFKFESPVGVAGKYFLDEVKVFTK